MTKAEQIARNLANKNYGVARAQLNSIQSTAKKDVARLKQQLSKKGLSKDERFVLNQRLNSSVANLKRVQHSVDVIRKSMKDPQHIRTNSAVENLKAFELQKEAQKIEFRKYQSKMMSQAIKTGKTATPSIASFSTVSREDALITNLLLKNPKYRLNLSRYNYYVREFNKYGINFDADVHNIFKTDKRFNSGDEYQGINELIEEYTYDNINTSRPPEEKKALEKLINELQEDLEEF